MTSRITFLGTAGDAAVYGKQYRSSGGIVIEDESMQILLNPGPGCLAKARQYGVNVADTSVILVTTDDNLSAHDLPVVIEAMTLHATKGVLLTIPQVLSTTAQHYCYVHPSLLGKLEKVIPLNPNHKLALNHIELETAMSSSTSVSFSLKLSDLIVSYVRDTPFSVEFAHKHMDSDMMIFHVPVLDALTGYTSVEDVLRYVALCKPSLTILTGFGRSLLDHDIFTLAKKMSDESGCKIVVALDGMEVCSNGEVTQRTKIRAGGEHALSE
jgi:hypothetical protein